MNTVRLFRVSVSFNSALRCCLELARQAGLSGPSVLASCLPALVNSLLFVVTITSLIGALSILISLFVLLTLNPPRSIAVTMPSATRSASSMPAASRPAKMGNPTADTDSDSSSSNTQERPRFVTRSRLRRELLKAGEIQANGIRNEFYQQRQQTNARFDAMEAKQTITDAKQNNQTAFRLRSKISSVGHLDASSRILHQPPNVFPKWVGTFWRLKERRNWHNLVRLHEFYGTEDWDMWGLDSFDSEDEESGDEIVPGHRTMRDAVEYAPDLALSELARHLGLNYHEISIHVTEDLMLERSRPTTSGHPKRLAGAIGSPSSEPKRSRPLGRRASPLCAQPPKRLESGSPTEADTPRSPTDVDSVQRLPLRDLIGATDDYPKGHITPAVSDSTRLGWKPPSDRYSSNGPSSGKRPSEKGSSDGTRPES